MDQINHKCIKAKKCYGHLGGKLGDRIFERMLELRWFARDGEMKTVYVVTKKGQKELNRLGINFEE